MSALGARSAIIGALFVTALHAAHGQRTPTTIAQLDHTVWAVRDGAPSYANSLAQTPDGVLWIGSVAGLLSGAHERAGSIGGHVDVRRRPGGGTIVSLELPIESPSTMERSLGR